MWPSVEAANYLQHVLCAHLASAKSSGSTLTKLVAQLAQFKLAMHLLLSKKVATKRETQIEKGEREEREKEEKEREREREREREACSHTHTPHTPDRTTTEQFPTA